MDRLNSLVRRVPEWAVWAFGLLPFAFLVLAVVQGSLGPDPVRAVEKDLGIWALRFLMASLAVSPLRWAGINLLRLRRALGLLAFTYAVLHLTAWIGLDLGLRLAQAVEDMLKRPYVIAGMLGLLAMMPLALTSSKAAIRRMGAVAWGRLHRLAYAALALGALHFVLLSKTWTGELRVYTGLAVLLLGLRLGRAVLRRWAGRVQTGPGTRVASEVASEAAPQR